MGRIEHALPPLREKMPAADVRWLARADRSVVGIEAPAWLTGSSGRSRSEAAGVMRLAGARHAVIRAGRRVPRSFGAR